MRTFLAAVVVLTLAACTPLAPAEPSTMSGTTINDQADTPLDVTPEPFVDPLASVNLTGSVLIQEHTLSGALLTIGNPSARLSMDLFLNPESPYAREFERSRLPELIESFVEPGALSIRIFILPITKYPGSASSARTIGCAAKQGKGYPAMQRLFETTRTSLTQNDATDLALDALPFLNCMQMERLDPLATSRARAAAYGVTLVPTYVINGEVFVGLPTEADLLGSVKAAL